MTFSAEDLTHRIKCYEREGIGGGQQESAPFIPPLHLLIYQTPESSRGLTRTGRTGWYQQQKLTERGLIFLQACLQPTWPQLDQTDRKILWMCFIWNIFQASDIKDGQLCRFKTENEKEKKKNPHIWMKSNLIYICKFKCGCRWGKYVLVECCMTEHFSLLVSPEFIRHCRCVRRVGGYLASSHRVSSVWSSPTTQRHHALSASSSLRVLCRKTKCRGVGTHHALHGVSGPEPPGLPEVGLWWIAGEHYIQTDGQHNRLGGLWLQSEWRHEGVRHRHWGTWTKWRLFYSKVLPFVKPTCIAVYFLSSPYDIFKS